MKKYFTLTQKDFDALLEWLSADRDEAGVQYEKIRDGLVRFFRFRGCSDPFVLADETINRVASKVETFDESGNVKKISYFYGFASNVFLEYLKTLSKREVVLDFEEFNALPVSHLDDDSANQEGACLEKCLNKLPPEQNRLIIEYYSKDKSEKFGLRKKLADERNLQMPALHTRVFRIRNELRGCIEKCLTEN